MVFLGLMAMSAVRWIVGAFELLQEQHLVRVTSPESFTLQTGKLFNQTSSPIPDLFLLLFSFLLSLTESQRTLVAVYQKFKVELLENTVQKDTLCT